MRMVHNGDLAIGHAAGALDPRGERVATVVFSDLAALVREQDARLHKLWEATTIRPWQPNRDGGRRLERGS